MIISNSREVVRIVRSALREDIGSGDITSRAFVPPSAQGRASFIFKEPAIVCGLPLLPLIFRSVSPSVRVLLLPLEGRRVAAGSVVARVHGPLRPILAGERVALNFLQRLSGIATLTRAYVDRARGYRAKIMDTRKTTPLLRVLEKYAVKVGGGWNHRRGLDDAVLVKTNHFKASAAGDLSAVVRRARRFIPRGGFLEVEARDLDEALRLAALDIDVLMLDNFALPALRAAVRRIRAVRPDLLLEASGGITIETVAAVAAAGVDRISVGALTHSSGSVDVALRVEGAAR